MPEITRLRRTFRLVLNVIELDPETHPIYWNYSGFLSDGSFSLANAWSRVLKGHQAEFSLVLKKPSVFLKKSDHHRRLNLIFQFVLLSETVLVSFPHQKKLRLKTTNKLIEDLKALLTNGEESDVTVRAQNGSFEFRAHRYILGARSPILDVELTEKRTGVLDLVDWEPEVVWNFLFFLYTGYVDHLKPRNAIRLYKLADKYKVEDLKELCLKCIEKNLTVDEICDVFRLALKLDLQGLLVKATDFLAHNMEKIIPTNKWRDFNSESPNQAVDILSKALEGPVLKGSKRPGLSPGKRQRSTPSCSSVKKIKTRPMSDSDDES